LQIGFYRAADASRENIRAPDDLSLWHLQKQPPVRGGAIAFNPVSLTNERGWVLRCDILSFSDARPG
jgi:hypothetical protein